MPDETAPDGTTLTGFGAVVVLIGLNFVAVRVSNVELAPLWGAALRYVVAAGLVVLLMRVRRVPFPRGKGLEASLWFGTLNFAVFFGLMYWALVAVPPGVASVVLAAVPLFTYLMALALRLERFRWAALMGALMVIVGIGIIAQEGLKGGFPLVRFVAVIGAALAAAAAGIVVKSGPRTHPLAMNGVGMSAGAVLLLAATLVAGEPRALPTEPAAQAAVVYLILSSVVLFVLLIWVIGRWTASGVAYATVLAPIVTIIAAHLLLDDPVTSRLLTGGAFIVAGVYWGALRRKRPKGATRIPMEKKAAREAEPTSRHTMRLTEQHPARPNHQGPTRIPSVLLFLRPRRHCTPHAGACGVLRVRTGTAAILNEEKEEGCGATPSATSRPASPPSRRP